MGRLSGLGRRSPGKLTVSGRVGFMPVSTFGLGDHADNQPKVEPLALARRLHLSDKRSADSCQLFALRGGKAFRTVQPISG